MNCNCDYCYFQTVGMAKEIVDFADQKEAKKKALEFIFSAFREANPKRRQDGLSENTIAIMLGEWGLGKTQLLKYIRTAINNSSGVSQYLRDEYDIPYTEDGPLSKITFRSFVEDILKEDPNFESYVEDKLNLINEQKGVAFRIDALKFHDEIHGEHNLLIPLFNIVLRRCQIEHRITTEEDLRSATKLITDKLNVNRIFIFFDELEALKSLESETERFDIFFQNFATRIKGLLDNSSPPDVSVCIATIPSVWEALTRQFEELGALKSRASKSFIRLSHLTLEKTHHFILSRCGDADNCPFSEGTIRTLLQASGKNPRCLNQLLFGLQPEVKNSSLLQHDIVLEYLENAAADRVSFNYDSQSLFELKDVASEIIDNSNMTLELLNVLTGGLREWAAPDLYRYLGKSKVGELEKELNTLCSINLRGIYTCVKLNRLDRAKALMQDKSLSDQKKHLLAQGYLSESDIRIERQTLLVHDLEYERGIISPLESRLLGKSEVWCFLPVNDESGLEELQSLWKLNHGPALQIYHTLRNIALISATVPYYRLSMAAREKIFPGQSPKEPPFEWVDETYWHEVFGYLYDPSTPKNDKRIQLVNGLRLAGRAYGAKCVAVDETSFLLIMDNPNIKNSQYFDAKPLRCLIQTANDFKDLKTPEFDNRLLSNKPDFLLCISTTHMSERPNTIPCEDGRPQIEVIYYELDSRMEFQLQLLSNLNEEASNYGWFISEKMKVAEETLGEDVYGETIDKWLKEAEKSGYLVKAWQMPYDTREDSLARVIRELISILPNLPATYEEILGLLRKFGVKDPLDQDLIDVCLQNGQLIRDAQDRLSLQVLPSQKAIIRISDRFPRGPGGLSKDYLCHISKYFWQGSRTNLNRDLERHLLVVEEIGYFDGHNDLDLLLQNIDEKLEKIRKKDKDGAYIDQYAYEVRRGQIGAKRAERLVREKDYFREQYRLHENEFHKIEKDINILIPRIIRHQLIEIEKRIQEIIATGEGPFLDGQKAVRHARGILESTHYGLIGEGSDIKIKDHMNELQDYLNHNLLKELISSHRDGIIADDEGRGLRSASSLTKELENEMEKLEKEKTEVRKSIDRYNQLQRNLMTKANELSKQPGLKEQIHLYINQLESADPKSIYPIFKKEFENVGLITGKKKVQDAIKELDSIANNLEKTATHAKDLGRLNTIIGLLNENKSLLSTFMEPSYVSIWGEKYEIKSVARKGTSINKEVESILLKAKNLQREFSATATQTGLLTEIVGQNEDLGKKIQELDQGAKKVIAALEKEICGEEQRFIDEMKEMAKKSEWHSKMTVVIDKLFRREMPRVFPEIIDETDITQFDDQKLEPILGLLRKCFWVVQGVTELGNWLSAKHIQFEDYQGTDLEDDVSQLIHEKNRIESISENITIDKNWDDLFKNLRGLLWRGEEGEASSAAVHQFNQKILEIKTLVKEKIDNHVKGTKNYIGALFSADLLEVSKRRNLLDDLDGLSTSDKPYIETIRALKGINQSVNENAKIQLKDKKFPDDHNPDTALTIVQEVYRQEGLPFSQAIRLDKGTNGRTILWLIREGVLNGKIQLGGD